ncbi:hypothetical protein Fmac_032137 [Flemingia macrophylla]|uniref:Ubiquitin-like domain-containing protein n=1 Tax=Flemingia macrophylla TaxID=520843 RepID=A0ABD1L419_9FABA
MSFAGVTSLSLVPRELLLSPNGCYTPLHLSLDHKFIFIYLSYFGSLTPMQVLHYDNIESIKLKIQKAEGLSSLINKQKLVCDGRELPRSNYLLKEYGVNRIGDQLVKFGKVRRPVVGIKFTPNQSFE